jgi:hypothetical protein
MLRIYINSTAVRKNLECKQPFSEFFHVLLNLKDELTRVNHTDGNASGLHEKTET